MSSSINEIYEFGAYRLDAGERLLTGAAGAVALPPKVFELLLVLVESRGRALRKDEIISALWPDSFVEESNLTHYISQLRRTLADGGQYIETVPKLGYRFVAEVRVVQAAPASSSAAADTPATPPRQRVLKSRRWLTIGGAALLLALAGGLFSLRDSWLIRGNGLPPFQSLRLTKLTNNGQTTRAALSPDGRFAAYVVEESQRQSLWVRQTDTASEVQLCAPQEAV